MIAEQTGRVARLLEDFSELVRPGTRATELEDETADLNVALDAAGRELAGLATHLQQSMTLSPAAGAALITGHQGRVTQALRALLEYFLVSSPRASSLEARVDLPGNEAEAVVVTITRHAPTGQKAPESALDWSRVSPAAARRIVEQHGGSLEVADEDQDLSLVVTWPRRRGVLSLRPLVGLAGGHRPGVPARGQAGRLIMKPDLRLLVVDDDSLVTRTLAEALTETCSAQVWSAASGEEGAHLAALHHPDLVLLDLDMPGADGLDVCRELRAHPATAETVIWILTGLQPDSERLAHTAGLADRVLIKPVSLLELTLAIQQTITPQGPPSPLGRGRGLKADRAPGLTVALPLPIISPCWTLSLP